MPSSIRIRDKRGIHAVKTLVSAKTLTALAAGMLLIVGLLGIQNSTDTAQAAATGTVNLTNGWSNLSTAASPAKLAAGTTPTYVGSGKSLFKEKFYKNYQEIRLLAITGILLQEII